MYLRARNYDPVIGRFTQQDPAMDGLNWYTYCGGNPVMYWDPTGNWPKLDDVTRTLADWLFANPVCVYATQQGWFSDLFYTFGFSREPDTGIYHTRPDAWQQVGGFNDFYDIVFDYTTYMENAKFQFTSGNREYIFWAWKGDYLNLGAGAELGIYSNKSGILGRVDVTSPIDGHWLVDTSIAMPMTMTLSDKKGNQIFSYNPSEEQWWITGFNPYKQGYMPGDLTATFDVTFDNKTMYTDFYNTWHGKNIGWTFDSNNYKATFIF